MTKVVTALKEEGIDPKDIQTTNFSVSPVYDRRPYDKPAPPVVVGYRVTNQVRITLHDTTRLGAILDQLVTLGSNQIDAIEFGVEEPETLKDEARKLALKNVTDNAKLYADAAGVSLGPILSISEEESSYQPHFAPAATRMETAKDVPIEAGNRHGRGAGQGDLGNRLTGAALSALAARRRARLQILPGIFPLSRQAKPNLEPTTDLDNPIAVIGISSGTSGLPRQWLSRIIVSTPAPLRW